MKGTIREQAKNNAHTRTGAKKGCSILGQEVSQLGRTEFGTIRERDTKKAPHQFRCPDAKGTCPFAFRQFASLGTSQIVALQALQITAIQTEDLAKLGSDQFNAETTDTSNAQYG
jgi:hypothetical protein